jgi:hypothetical protein
MPIQFINTGTSANAGNGDSIRSAFNKVNQSLSYLDTRIETSPAFNLDPILNNLTVTNNLTVLNTLDFGSAIATLKVNTVTSELLVNNQPILGDFTFISNNILFPESAYFNSNRLPHAASPEISIDDIPGAQIPENIGTILLDTGASRLRLHGVSRSSTNSNFLASIGVSTDLSDETGDIAFSLFQSPGTNGEEVGVLSATTASSKFQFLRTSGTASSYASGFVTVNSGTLTGVMSNHRGTWINGGPDGVTIANDTAGWQFTANGSLIFPDETEQTSAFICDQSLNTFDVVQFAGLTSTGTIFQGTAYDGSSIPDTTIRIDSNRPNYTQIFVKNHNSSTTATSDLMIFNDQGNAGTSYIDLGINSSDYIEPGYGLHSPGSGYLFAKDVDLVIGTDGVNTKLFFHAGGDGVNDSAMELDAYALRINRSVQTVVGTAGPLNFTVWNTQNNSAAQAVYQAMNDAGEYLKLGLNSTNSSASYGNIRPRDGFVHIDGSTATLHIGGTGDLVFWSDEPNGGYETGSTATLRMSRVNRTSTFGGHVLPAADLTYDLGSSSSQWRSVYVSNDIKFSDGTTQTTAYQIVSAPTSSTSTGAAGTIAYDNSYFYVCTATNAWQRVGWDNTPW